MKFYVTFGSSHLHTVNGDVFNHRTVAEIEADSYESARQIAFDHFGREWAFIYNNKNEAGVDRWMYYVIPLQKEVDKQDS